METEDKKTKLPNDDWVVFIPDEEMRAIERASLKMWQARRELQKIRDEMKRVENGETKFDEVNPSLKAIDT